MNSTGLLSWSKSKMFLSHLQTKTKIQGKYDLMRCDGSNLSLEVMSPFYIIESDTRKNCEITLSCEPTDSHLSAASVQYFSFSYSQKFFLTFFFNFLKTKMALVVCTRRKQLHTLLIRCNHSRPTNIHNTDEDFNSSTMFLSRFLLRLHHQLRLNAEGFKKWSNINSSDLIFLWKHVGVGN